MSLLCIHELQELFIVHLLICNVLSVMEQGIIRDGCRSILRFFSALDMDRAEWYAVLSGSLLTGSEPVSLSSGKLTLPACSIAVLSRGEG